MQNNNTKERPIRLMKRASLSRGHAIMLRVAAIVLALITGGLFLLVLGQNPIPVYGTMLSGSIGTLSAVKLTAKLAIPLLITSLGVTRAFQMQFWNIGAEGQICAGAIAASYFALFHANWPQPVLLVVMALAAIVVGGLFGLIPAYFKCRFGTNETLLTLMLNYVAMYTIQTLQQGPWRDPDGKGFAKIARFDTAARLPSVLGVHIGWIVALALVVLLFIYLKHTKQGYELSVVGENENTARYAGMNVKKIIMRTMFISAAICGLAGMLQASGADKTLNDTVAGGVGFTAITVSWLSGLHPVVMLFVTILFCILEKGSDTVQSIYNLSPSAAEVFQGIILFFVLGSEFFIRYRVVFFGGDKHLKGGVERV